MNNRKFRIWNMARLKRKLMEGLSMGRTLALLMLGSLLFFLLLGLGGMAEKGLNTSPVSTMKGLAASLSSRFFMDMIGMEMPQLAPEQEASALSSEKVAPFVFEFLTNVNPRDPKSLIASEIPGMKSNQPVPLRSGSGNEQGEAPADYRPEVLDSEEPPEESPGRSPGNPGDPDANETPDKPAEGSGSAGKGQNSGGSSPSPSPQDPKAPPQELKKTVLIYHSHPQEAFNPLLSKQSSNPGSTSPSKNIMLVGSMVAKRLESKGIGTVHDQSDYQSTVPDYNWNYSYKYSRQTVKTAMAENEELTYLIDIHRDSQRHGKTTTTINGEGYAQVYFIIGHGNQNWRKNEELANRINQKLEKSYPGISRGIWGKSADQGNGEYNQSLSPNSILVEIGGIDNTKEELQRTSEVLADMLAEVIWEEQQAEKVNASKDGSAKQP
ncbi:stage II sporulation protein P [Paenibacillus sp. F411]|uniref:stage II sporulation protein P n=1 Tax=Paenibacillus sp. F411 TaxID=2820239 RepID=UPI001AAF1D0D|nr:stage II sporulation protein P [Paenibacillus sp. F411]MBO2943289.1 stage II sporulation protein P [Paenibacillus sp. F411]